MGWLMRWTLTQLRPVGISALTAVLWWPWLPPVVAILLVAGTGHLGMDWLIWTVVGVGLVGLAALLGLAYLGSEARRAANPTSL